MRVRHGFGFITRCCLFLLVISCASLKEAQNLNPKTYYRNDIKVTVNGQIGLGTLVAKSAKSYEIEVKSPGQINMIKWSTCHREGSTEEVKGTLFKSPGDKYTFTYKPITGIEDIGSCPMKIETYDSSSEGRHGSAFIDFSNETLEAEIKCNGIAYLTSGGVSVCESKEGLLQEINFREPLVLVETGSARCPAPKGKASFQIELPNRECVYLFMTPDGRRHRLTTIGYEQIAIRSN